MPAMYEALLHKFMKEGMSKEAAQRKAARIYNSKRKKGQKPVTGSGD